MKKSAAVFVMTAASLLVACSNEQTAAEQDTNHKEKGAVGEFQPQSNLLVEGELTPVEGMPGSKVTVGPGLQRLVDLASKDLMANQSIAAAGIEIVQADYVSWPDSSLGCPQPGYQYLQVITNGSRIVLRANKQLFHYHSGNNRPPTHCKKPSPVKPALYAPGEA